jgi:hypothetical protein
MISGGNATVYVADAAVQFYTATLGLTLTNRFGNHWATLETRPCSGARTAPGSPSVFIPPRRRTLRQERGTRITSDIIRYEGGNRILAAGVR